MSKNLQLGEVAKICEIDESMFPKVKHLKVKKNWIKCYKQSSFSHLIGRPISTCAFLDFGGYVRFSGKFLKREDIWVFWIVERIEFFND
ncbi:hypothetical protein BpHYR1_006746 [Brachionus plicatilis]|uniref:Uncharacterized protein n=1 Tax=Brachionus plicatilis TaxID=10195 RepID=A0A3M7RKW0_BRAPC|nr:hypothetical protein BpHYR1_006746 [Brachionus plicatilis]